MPIYSVRTVINGHLSEPNIRATKHDFSTALLAT